MSLLSSLIMFVEATHTHTPAACQHNGVYRLGWGFAPKLTSLLWLTSFRDFRMPPTYANVFQGFIDNLNNLCAISCTQKHQHLGSSDPTR